MALTDKYPLNISELSKGQLLSTEQLAELVGRKPDDPKWPFLIMALQSFIQENTEFTVKITMEGLRILTDSEAATHNHRRFNGHIGGALRRYQRNGLVDASKLSVEEAEIHSRNLVNESRYVSALTQAGKKIAIDARKQAVAPPAPQIAARNVSVDPDNK